MKAKKLILTVLLALVAASQAASSETWLLVQVHAAGRVLSNLHSGQD
jgi:hypothetical protein